MAQVTQKVQVNGFYKVRVKMFNQDYDDVILYVMKNLCADIILGLDFLNFHERVIFEMNGNMGDLIVPASSYCAVMASNVESPSLFSNLRSGCKPIATKSRRFNLVDKAFIKTTVDKWLQDGTVRLSRSSWRAQCVVVKRDGSPQRLAIDKVQEKGLPNFEREAMPGA